MIDLTHGMLSWELSRAKVERQISSLMALLTLLPLFFFPGTPKQPMLFSSSFFPFLLFFFFSFLTSPRPRFPFCWRLDMASTCTPCVFCIQLVLLMPAISVWVHNSGIFYGNSELLATDPLLLSMASTLSTSNALISQWIHMARLLLVQCL